MPSAYQFSTYLGIGAIAGLCWSWWLVRQNNPHRFSSQKLEYYLESMLLTGLGTLAGAMVGSRISYVWLHWSYYSRHTAEIWQVWAGGLDWTGSLWGALILIFLINGLRDQNPRQVLNDLLPFFTWFITALWLASLVSHTYYGPLHVKTWWTLSVVDQAGESQSRIPIHLLAALLTVIAGSWLDGQSKWWLKTLRFEWFLLFQMLVCIGLSFWRADPASKAAEIPADLMFACLYLVFISVLIGVKVSREYKKPQIV
jgi:prolipoprotein diacylglyceryltransferase